VIHIRGNGELWILAENSGTASRKEVKENDGRGVNKELNINFLKEA
jgi:hypothetical protein